jgi:hypothetical protein
LRQPSQIKSKDQKHQKTKNKPGTDSNHTPDDKIGANRLHAANSTKPWKMRKGRFHAKRQHNQNVESDDE